MFTDRHIKSERPNSPASGQGGVHHQEMSGGAVCSRK